jgi:hypothetical protein
LTCRKNAASAVKASNAPTALVPPRTPQPANRDQDAGGQVQAIRQKIQRGSIIVRIEPFFPGRSA